MKFDSTLVNVDGKEIVIVAVDTNFFSLFFEYFHKPIVLMAVNPQGDMQYFGRPDLTNLVANLKFGEFEWTTNEIAD